MQRRLAADLAAAATVAVAALAVGFTVAGWEAKQHTDRRLRAVALTGGDPERGAALLPQHGCHGCHSIAGSRGAQGAVGPPLDTIGARTYLGGVVLNTPDNLVRWIRDAPSLSPKTAMPRLDISEAQARDIAAYLYSQD